MKITFEILRALAEKYEIQWCDEYGEPGYSKSNETGRILFANWNTVPSHVSKALEKENEIEWSDEWYIDYNRSKAYRTSPDCYSWTPSVIFWEELGCEGYSVDDLEDDPAPYLEALKNNASKCDILGADLAEHGYQKINADEYENGWYGTCDDPHKILEKLLEVEPEGVFIFGGISQEQFRTCFNVYRKVAE